MPSLIRLCVALLVCAGLSACTVPVHTKAAIQSRLVSESQKAANYLTLARYWDTNARKASIDFKSASYLTFWEQEQTAEITIGNGPYYGMIELKALDAHTTRIRCYAWGAFATTITEWRAVIESAPND